MRHRRVSQAEVDLDVTRKMLNEARAELARAVSLSNEKIKSLEDERAKLLETITRREETISEANRVNRERFDDVNRVLKERRLAEDKYLSAEKELKRLRTTIVEMAVRHFPVQYEDPTMGLIRAFERATESFTGTPGKPVTVKDFKDVTDEYHVSGSTITFP